MKRTFLAATSMLLSCTLVVSACGDKKDEVASTTAIGSTSGVTKAAWIYVGPTSDGGWTQAHDAGRKYVEDQLGSKVKTTFKENVPEGPEVAQAIEDLVKDGNTIIFGTSFGFSDAMAAAAKKHPDVYFEMATGAETSKNLATYYGAAEDANYLAGMTAGAATTEGTIGFVAPFPIPEVIRHINGYALGVQSVNPSAKVKVVWINSWFDPAKERQAAESLIAGGADVIANGGDSPAPGEAAKEKGVKWTGWDFDQSKNFPDIWLTAAVFNWGPYYLGRVKAAGDGSWKTGNYYGNLADGFTDIAPFGSSVAEDTRAKVEARKVELAAKPQSEFTGPIEDQSGTVKIAAGKQASQTDLAAMDWFVKGVEGSPTG